MKTKKHKVTVPNSKGASIFKKMIEDKQAIHDYLKAGGNISDLAEKYNLVKIVSITAKQ